MYVLERRVVVVPHDTLKAFKAPVNASYFGASAVNPPPGAPRRGRGKGRRAVPRPGHENPRNLGKSAVMCLRAIFYAVSHSIRKGSEGSKLKIVDQKASDGRVSQSGFQFLRWL